MNKTNAALIAAGVLLIFCGLYFFFPQGKGPAPVAGDRPEPLPAAEQTLEPPETDEAEAGALEQERRPEPEAYHPRDIEEIKKQIYDLEIEDIADIPLLDSVVQTGNAPVRDLWKGGWMSVDDTKEALNGFKLEPQSDGTFIFYPDENTTRTYTFFETPKTYTYDPVKREFYWVTDYYGKTISHRARFINENVLAMMLISGRKVTLDLYQKQPDKEPGSE